MLLSCWISVISYFRFDDWEEDKIEVETEAIKEELHCVFSEDCKWKEKKYKKNKLSLKEEITSFLRKASLYVLKKRGKTLKSHKYRK